VEVADSLGRLIAVQNPARVVMAGVSAGGYAALAFGAILGADVVLAFSPQTVIDPEVLAAINDHRWDSWVQGLIAAHALDRSWADLREALPAAANARTRYEVYFAEADPFDKLHAERLAGVPRVRLYRLGRGGHFVVSEMRNSGALEKVLRRALQGDRAPHQPASSPIVEPTGEDG
jgi:acetyl esterase/lipase